MRWLLLVLLFAGCSARQTANHNNFVKLTATSGGPVYVNAKHIKTIGVDHDTNYTSVLLTTGERTECVDRGFEVARQINRLKGKL